MKRLSTFILLFAVSFSQFAFGQDFIDGWYFNLNEPGNGFNVNRQAGITEVALFDYRDDESNEWFIAVGSLTRNAADTADVFDAEQLSFTGSCFDCDYEPSVATPTDALRVEFMDRPNADGFSVAQVTLRGKTETYVRFIFGFAGPLGFLLGNWNFTQLVEDTTTQEIVPFTDVVQFNEIDTQVAGSATIIIGDVLSNNSATIGATLLSEGPFAGNALVLAFDLFDGLDAAFLFAPAKENLTGTVQLADDIDDAMDTLIAGGGDLLTGARIGQSFTPTGAASSVTSESSNSAAAKDRLIERMPLLADKTTPDDDTVTTRESNASATGNSRLKQLLIDYAERLNSLPQ